MPEPAAHPPRRRTAAGAGPFVLKLAALALIAAGVGVLAGKKLGLGQVPGWVIGGAVFGVAVFAQLRLKGAPREMGVIFGLKLLSVTAYKILNFTLMFWLTRDLGFADDRALWLISSWAILMSVTTVLAGSLTDALGLRRTLLAGVTLCIAARLVMALTENRWLALGCGMVPLAVGEALCTPVLVAALRRYSTAAQRSVAFSLFYAIMNFGFMVGYFVCDGVQQAFGEAGTLPLPGIPDGISGYRALLLVSMAIELLIIPLVLLLRGADKAPSAAPSAPAGGGLLGTAIASFRAAAVETGRLFAGLVRHPGFYRLLAFLALIGLLKIVFNVMDFVLPPFAKRELGEQVLVGRFNVINGILILVLAPAIGLATRKFPAYAMVVTGGLITAASFVFMVPPPAWFQPAADGLLGRLIGHGYMELTGPVHPYYVMIVLWQIVFSIGEAFYSPRVYEYAASIAPPGQEASYASLSYVPLLIGKLVTGAAFGGLLARYCPAEGPRSSGTMWLIIGLMVAAAPTGLLVLRRFIQVKEEGRDP